MSRYTILDNGMGDFVVKEKTRTHTGVRWITLENTIDSFDSLEKAKENLTEDIKVRLEEIQDLIPNFANLPETLQIALFSEYFRGSIRQSPKTVKLINQGRYQEAAGEFLDNDEYRDAEERGRRGIRGRMKKVFDELNKLALKTTKSS